MLRFFPSGDFRETEIPLGRTARMGTARPRRASGVYAASREEELPCVGVPRCWGASEISGAPSLRHGFRPAATASKSVRRSRKLPGSTSTFCKSPALIIRQRVARLTPKNFADADMPISKGPCVIGNGLRTRCSKISSIASNCPDDASSSFFNLSSVVMGSPPGCSAAHTGQSQCFARKSGNRTAMNWK